jgi:hypothetical protein
VLLRRRKLVNWLGHDSCLGRVDGLSFRLAENTPRQPPVRVHSAAGWPCVAVSTGRYLLVLRPAHRPRTCALITATGELGYSRPPDKLVRPTEYCSRVSWSQQCTGHVLLPACNTMGDRLASRLRACEWTMTMNYGVPESWERRTEPALACHVEKRISISTTSKPHASLVQVVWIIHLHQSYCINANIMNILLPTLISQTQMLAVIPKLLFYLNTIINMIQLLIDHIVQQLNALPKLERRHTLFSSFLIILLKLDVKSML